MIEVGIDQGNDVGMITDQGQPVDLFSKSWTDSGENLNGYRLSCAFLSGAIGRAESSLAKLFSQSVAGYFRLLSLTELSLEKLRVDSATSAVSWGSTKPGLTPIVPPLAPSRKVKYLNRT